MLLTEIVEVSWERRNKSWYINKGYQYTKIGDIFSVKVKDLTESFRGLVEVLCDYCECKVEKKYKDYIKNKQGIIKKDCCANCRSLKRNESNIAKYGINSWKYTWEDIVKLFKDNGLFLVEKSFVNSSTKMKCICPKHKNKEQLYTLNDIVSSKQGCKYCAWDKLSYERRLDYNFVKNEFDKYGFDLLEDNYINAKIKMKIRCRKHPDIIQESTYDNFQQTKNCCKKCHYEKSSGSLNYGWKGGISPVANYLRDKTVDWKKDTMKFCKFKCVISGERFDDIHHLYGFNKILEELFEITNLPIYKIINEYTEEELIILVDKCSELHYKYGFGVCLTRNLHDEFHSIYGYGNNTPEQFEEFKQMHREMEVS